MDVETTIQVDKRTVQMLKMLKEDMRARSYDEVILRLSPIKVPKSMFGSNPKLKPVRQEYRMEDRF
jgi:hypothetical protein